MKKKGLIISTVVMVVVLIASLTTATYAWFTTSNKTTIEGFNVSVVSNNAVNIGIKGNYTHVSGVDTYASPDLFYTGDMTFSGAEAGTRGSGEWESTTRGLSSTLNPNITWGAQNSAFGILNPATSANFTTDTLDTLNTNVGDWTQTNVVDGALAVAGTKKDATTVSLKKAIANHGAAIAEGGFESGDYVHFILGVSPTKDLETNEFVVAIEPTGTATALGVLASIHVAYRMTTYGGTTTNWVDVDMYGTNYNGNTLKTNVTADATTGGIVFTDELKKAYKASYGSSETDATVNPATGAIALVINGLDRNKDNITQLEIVIYMSGTDPDCNDQGKTSQGSIKMFFHTAEPTT